MKKNCILLILALSITGCQSISNWWNGDSKEKVVIKKTEKSEYDKTEQYWIDYLKYTYPNWRPTKKIKKHNLVKVIANSFKGSKYTVQGNETLFDIALAFYGDGTKWTIISAVNKDIKVLKPGIELIIPQGQ